MVKPSGIVGRCVLAAVLSIGMVPASAMAQVEPSDTAIEAAVQADEPAFPHSQAGGSLANLPVTAYWSDVAPGAPIQFLLESHGSADRYSHFQYRLDSVKLLTSNGWENIDYSYRNQYQDSPNFQVTLNTSGTYRVGLSCLGFFAEGVSSATAEYSSIEVELVVDDANFPTVDQRIDQIVAQCNAQGFTSEYDKALWLHDWIVDNCEYDYQLTSAGSDALLAVGTGTCAAYRTVYEMLLAKVGIQSKRMTGNGHEWNAVKLDGVWCQVDVTWNDDSAYDVLTSLSEEEKTLLRHQYFGMSDDFTALVHGDHKVQLGYECPSLDNHYLVKNGYVAQWADYYQGAIAQKIAAGETEFTVKADAAALGSSLSMYGEVPHLLMAWELSNRDWSVARSGENVSAEIGYEHGAQNALGQFTVKVVKNNVDLGSVPDGGGSSSGSNNSGSGVSGGNSGSASTPTVKPAPAPEKAKPGLSAYGSSYRYGKANGTYAKNEWVTIGGKRYYFGADGRAAKWETWINGSLYYFNGKCQMVSGWVTWNADKTKSYFSSSGKALTGLQKIGGATYYFDPKTGKSQKWEQWINGSLYYFNGKYQMVTGWVTWNADKSKSYFGVDGKARSGFMKQGSATYYLSPKTFKSVKWEQRINGSLYYFNGKYQMVTGWVTWNADKSKSYFGSNGKALTGFQRIGGATYYFDPATCKSKKWEQWIGGKLYYFNGKYQMVTGWVTWNNDKSKSYFDGSGRALTGWQKIGGYTYYFNPATARSVKWEQNIGSARYYFDGNGRMHTGWLQWNADKKWSYFYSNGKMATGTQTIDGTRYTFDANGKTSQAPAPTITGDAALDRQIYAKAKQLGSLSACFNWVKNHTHTNWAGKGHHYSYGNYNLNSSWVIAEAKRMMNGQPTDCYAYAATFACMAKALGYNVQAVAGALPLRSGGVSYHGWCVIYQGGGTYVYDPNLAHSYPQYNFYKITYGSAPLTYIR